MFRKIKALYRAGYTDYDGLDTYRVIPTRNVPIEALEPFIFLNHHGPQTFAPENNGLPFGPHPHRGFETVTFILQGDIMHADSTGYKSTIRTGGIQWMTAGSGIIHSETSSEEFKKQGGPVNILQLWINLPSHLKNTAPGYMGLQKEDIPVLTTPDNKVKLHIVSGEWQGEKAPVHSISDVSLCWMEFEKDGTFEITVPTDRTILLYVIEGKILVNDSHAEVNELVEFADEGETVLIKAKEKSILLFGHASPNREPIVAHGPFVMNTQEEIRQAFVDYQQGKFGVWED